MCNVSNSYSVVQIGGRTVPIVRREILPPGARPRQRGGFLCDCRRNPRMELTILLVARHGPTRIAREGERWSIHGRECIHALWHQPILGLVLNCEKFVSINDLYRMPRRIRVSSHVICQARSGSFLRM